MARRNATNRKRVLDPFFGIPEDLADWSYDENALAGENDDALEGDIELDEVDSPGVLQPPGTLTVVSQDIRTKDNGDKVVDIVIEFETIEGADDYDIRVTKID